MPFMIDRSTTICLPGETDSALRYAADAFSNDVARVVGVAPEIIELPADRAVPPGRSAIIVKPASPAGPFWDHQETYCRKVEQNGRVLRIEASDTLGAVYGLYDISRDFLDIDPFWFWTGHQPACRARVEIPDDEYRPPRPAVRLRGWFVNGEDCLIGWPDEYPIPSDIWQRVYETILRCGGNLVIAGTDLPRSSPHRRLAAEMGLWLTHHHAEILGAEMFARAYPGVEPRYDVHRDKFIELYRQAIEEQKHWKIVWTLGFRGQGDRPFWTDDPRYKQPAQRGKLLSSIIAEQRQLVLDHAGANNTVMGTNMYGEMVELYRQGHMQLPDDVIRIWGDNGYGVMVCRRRGTHNPRIPALPDQDESHLQHGIYYHVNFHDLQASNQLAMLPSPELIARELSGAIRQGADALMVVNSGNVRPHVLTLGLVMQLSRQVPEPGQEHRAGDAHCHTFGQFHFGQAAADVMACYRQYFDSLWTTGQHEDEKAGDETYHWTAKYLVGACLRRQTDKPLGGLAWATGADVTFIEQVKWFAEKTAGAQEGFDQLCRRAEQVYAEMNDNPGRRFFKDNLMTQAELHRSSNAGLQRLCLGVLAHCEQDHQQAFLHLSHAIKHYEKALAALRETEYGQWKNFYRGDWLVGVAETIRQVRILRSFVRAIGDPLFASWMRQLVPENERGVSLAYVWRRWKDDDELAYLLEHPEQATIDVLHRGLNHVKR